MYRQLDKKMIMNIKTDKNTEGALVVHIKALFQYSRGRVKFVYNSFITWKVYMQRINKDIYTLCLYIPKRSLSSLHYITYLFIFT